jgi:hypothetical protein
MTGKAYGLPGLLLCPTYPAAVAASGWDIAGTVADGVAGIGTVGALIWAVIVYRRQVKDAHIDQASKVFVTLLKGDLIAGSNYKELIVENGSDLPVFKLVVVLTSRQPRPEPRRRYTIDRLPARESVTYDDVSHFKLEERLMCSMSFMDAAGRGWVRDANGPLKSGPVDPG